MQTCAWLAKASSLLGSDICGVKFLKIFAARFSLLDRPLSSWRWLSLLRLALPSCSGNAEERSLDWPGYLTNTVSHLTSIEASFPFFLRFTDSGQCCTAIAGVWRPNNISLISPSGCGLRVPDLPRIPMEPISPTGRALSAIQRFWCHTLQGKSNTNAVTHPRALIASLL